MSDNFKKGLNPKFKASMKASKDKCPFIKPGRIMKEGRMTDAKCCTAFIPGFEVTEDRSKCECCTVPDMGVREDRCRFFAPLSISEGSAPKWHCRALGDKNIEPEQCSPDRCSRFEPIERLKWEIGRPVAKSADSDSQAPAKLERKRLVPKSEEMKKRAAFKKKDDSDGGYGGYSYW